MGLPEESLLSSRFSTMKPLFIGLGLLSLTSAALAQTTPTPAVPAPTTEAAPKTTTLTLHDALQTALKNSLDIQIGQNAVEVHVFPEAMRGTGEGSRPHDLRPNSTMTNATVADSVVGNDGHTLMIKYRGGEKKVVVFPETPVVTYVSADKSDLKPGAKVIAFTTAGVAMLDDVRHGLTLAEERFADQLGTAFASRLKERLAVYSAGEAR